MKTIQTVVKILQKVWGPPSVLTPELERYCQREGVDPWTLAEALRASDAPEPSPVTARKKEAPPVEMTVRSPLSPAS